MRDTRDQQTLHQQVHAWLAAVGTQSTLSRLALHRQTIYSAPPPQQVGRLKDLPNGRGFVYLAQAHNRRTWPTKATFLSRGACWSLAATECVSPPLSLPMCILLRISVSCATTELWPLLVLRGEKYLLVGAPAPCVLSLGAAGNGGRAAAAAVGTGRASCWVACTGV